MNIGEVLGLLKKESLTVKEKNSHIYSSSNEYQDDLIASKKLQMAWKTAKAGEVLQQSRNISKVRSFFRLCNV